MSFSISILDQASPAVRRLAEALSPRELGQVGGQAVANKLRDHFQVLQNTRANKDGWPRQNFWDQVRRSVQRPSITATGAEVSINHVGIGLRLLGGVVRPVATRFLTIPAQAAAYGKPAREFNTLVFRFMPNRWGKMQPALVESLRTEIDFGRKRKDGSRKVKSFREVGGSVMFWLTRQTTHKPDPSVLPPVEEMASAAVTAAQNYLLRKHQEGGARAST